MIESEKQARITASTSVREQLLEERYAHYLVELASLKKYKKLFEKQLFDQGQMSKDLELQYKKRIEILHGCILGYQSSFKQPKLDVNRLMIIWGRKTNPNQQPSYVVKNAKVEGTAIGAFFKASDKPNSSGWLGKLGYSSLRSPESSPELSKRTLVRRGSSLESMLEKIAADFYNYLNNGKYLVPKTRLAELPIENECTQTHALTKVLFQRINENRDTEISEGVYVMSKFVENYKDLAELEHCIFEGNLLNFEKCLESGKLPEYVMIEGGKVPLEGVMEILAISRLLADTDVLGGGARNTGFVIERDVNHKPKVVRAVKIDPGYAFNFTGQENMCFQSFNECSLKSNLLKKDRRHLQYGNMAKPLLWSKLTEVQQDKFILALEFGLETLRNNGDIFKNFVYREAFKQTPQKRELPNVEDYLEGLWENLNRQEKIYEKELKVLREGSVAKSEATGFQQGVPPTISCVPALSSSSSSSSSPQQTSEANISYQAQNNYLLEVYEEEKKQNKVYKIIKLFLDKNILLFLQTPLAGKNSLSEIKERLLFYYPLLLSSDERRTADLLQNFYFTLPNRDYRCDVLNQLSEWGKINPNKFKGWIEQLKFYPEDAAGNRIATKEKNKEFQNRLLSYTECYDDNQRNDYVATNRMKISWIYKGKIIHRLLRKTIQNELFNENGLPRKEKKVKDGERLVIPIRVQLSEQSGITCNNIEAFAKFYPEIPGYQIAVDLLCQRISGISLQASLVKITDLKQNKVYPLQISLNVGESLQEYLRFPHSPPRSLKEMEKNLSGYYLALKVFENLLTQVEDDKADNLCQQSFVDHDGETYLRLIGVDADHAWVDALLERQSRTKTEVKVQLKSLLFCFRGMLEEFNDNHQRAIKIFNRLDAYKVIDAWLSELDTYNKALVDITMRGREITRTIKGLFSVEEVEIFKRDNNCSIPILFKPGAVRNIYQRWRRLNEALKNDQEIPTTLLEVVERLEPRLAGFYSVAINKEDSPEKTFNSLPTDYVVVYEEGSGTVCHQSTLKIAVGATSTPGYSKAELEGVHHEYLHITESLGALKDSSSQAIIFKTLTSYPYIFEQVLKKIDFSEYEREAQKNILGILDKIDKIALQELYIKNCGSLASNKLDSLLRYALNLRVLVLNGIPVLSNSDFSDSIGSDAIYNIATYCKKLRRLDLTNLQKIQKIAFNSKFESLRYLSVNDCKRIVRVNLYAPEIKRINLNNLNDLRDVDIKSAKILERFQLLNCQSLTRINLPEAPELQVLTIEKANKLNSISTNTTKLLLFKLKECDQITENNISEIGKIQILDCKIKIESCKELKTFGEMPENIGSFPKFGVSEREQGLILTKWNPKDINTMRLSIVILVDELLHDRYQHLISSVFMNDDNVSLYFYDKNKILPEKIFYEPLVIAVIYDGVSSKALDKIYNDIKALISFVPTPFPLIVASMLSSDESIKFDYACTNYFYRDNRTDDKKFTQDFIKFLLKVAPLFQTRLSNIIKNGNTIDQTSKVLLLPNSMFLSWQGLPTVKITAGSRCNEKTDFVYRYFSGRYELRQPIIGVDFHTRKVKYNHTEFCVNLWDTATLERFDSMFAVYLRKSTIAVIFAPLFKGIERYLKAINSLQPMCQNQELPYVIIGMLSSERRRCLSYDEAKNIAEKLQAKAYFECNAETGRGIDETFEGVFELAIELAGFWEWYGEAHAPSLHLKKAKIDSPASVSERSVAHSLKKSSNISTSNSPAEIMSSSTGFHASANNSSSSSRVTSTVLTDDPMALNLPWLVARKKQK